MHTQGIRMKRDRAHAASGQNGTPTASPDQHPLPEQDPVAKQPRGRIRKSAQVDEQIFQEGLAISLENEKRQSKNAKQPPAKEAKPDAIQELESGSGAIVNEFQTMIDAMLPTTREERAACLSKAERRLATSGKKGKKEGHGSPGQGGRASRKKGGGKKGKK